MHGSMMSMHTAFDAILSGSEETTNTAWREIETMLRKMEKIMSRFDTESELYHLNAHLSKEPIAVSDELWDILTDCKRYYEKTSGLFDISLGKFDSLVFDYKEKTIFSTDERTNLDLGGYGKGYALAKIKDLLDAIGVKDALVNFGNSSITGIGHHPYGEYWPVGVENPYTETKLDDFRLKDTSLSISGNAPRHENHIVNPLNGSVARSGRMTAVISNSPVEAEVLTTVLMIADEETTKRITNNFDTTSIYIYNI
jgi:thiamine biosynthesis lipoprotein